MHIESCLLSPDLTGEGIYTVFLKEFDKQSLIWIKAKTAGTVQAGEECLINVYKYLKRR